MVKYLPLRLRMLALFFAIPPLTLAFLAHAQTAPAAPPASTMSGPATTAATSPATRPAATAPAPRDPRELTGFYNLMLQYRRTTPIGRGIPAAHVEGDLGLYTPRIASPKYNGIRIRAMSGPSRELAHATMTADLIYGRGGFAPGIRDVQFWASGHWLLAYLRAGLPQPPVQDDRRVLNNSWIGPDSPAAPNVLRRLDYLADTADKLFVVGVNNGSGSAVPALLASAYNVIAVGQYDGASSGGYTTIEGPGRCKPDIVAPGALTSYCTPVVTAAVAGLLEAADKMKVPQAPRCEVIRAVLLAGAEKPPQWNPQPGKPLDEHFGAGRLRMDLSHRILRSGPVSDGKATADGWVFAALKPGGQYSQSIDISEDVAEVSIILTWNRRVDGRLIADLLTGRSRWNDEARLADFDLQVRTQGPAGRIVGESTSTIDNVEHVYLKSPQAGSYQIRVLRRDDGWPESWDFALAWRTESAAPATQP